MTLTNEQAQAAYLRAKDALDAISKSRQATQRQKDAARAQRDALTLEFIGTNIAAVEERTAKFQSFIANMTGLIEDLSADALLRGMRGLTEVITAAQPLLAGNGAED
ncbi:MAG: hypothetical protein IT439_11840 [Phycisphaerales bacterium]|nr:hypothetical protein [Phycisphaerales bacterium]